MSIKSKVLAAAATLTLVGGVGAVGTLTAGSASAGTPSCGPTCINLFNKDFAGFNGGAASPVDVYRQSEKVGNPIILFRSQQLRPGPGLERVLPGHRGGARHPRPAVPGDRPPLRSHRLAGCPAFENEYAPFGVDSGLCSGVAATAYQGEGVTLQPCGVSGKTLWIVDFNENNFNNFPGVPLINGSNTNFSHPFVLTYPANANPTDKPRPQLTVTNLTGFTQPGFPFFPVISSVDSSQLFFSTFGVLP